MRSEGTVVGSVCLSVTPYLTSPMFVSLTNDMTYLTGDEGQKLRAVFSENALLQSYSGFTIVRLMPTAVGHFTVRKTCMHIIHPRGGKRPFRGLIIGEPA